MRRFADVDEVYSSIGEPIGPGDWMEISQKMVTAFAESTGDKQWIHIDAERAASGPFKGTVAHGYLMLSLLPRFAASMYSLDFGSARVNYGSNRVRYPSPVVVGSRVRPHAVIAGCVEGEKGILITSKFSVEISGGAKPGLVAEILTLIVP